MNILSEISADLWRKPQTKWGARIGRVLVTLNLIGFVSIWGLLIHNAIRTLGGSYASYDMDMPTALIVSGAIVFAIWLIWNRLEAWHKKPAGWEATVEIATSTISSTHPDDFDRKFLTLLRNQLVSAQSMLDINDPEEVRNIIVSVSDLMWEKIHQPNRVMVYSEPLEQTKVLWQVIDKINTAALDAAQGHTSHETASTYALNASFEAMKRVPHPGEPVGVDSE